MVGEVTFRALKCGLGEVSSRFYYSSRLKVSSIPNAFLNSSLSRSGAKQVSQYIVDSLKPTGASPSASGSSISSSSAPTTSSVVVKKPQAISPRQRRLKRNKSRHPPKPKKSRPETQAPDHSKLIGQVSKDLALLKPLEVAWVALSWTGQCWKNDDRPENLSKNLTRARTALPEVEIAKVLHQVAKSWKETSHEVVQSKVMLHWAILDQATSIEYGKNECVALAEDLYSSLNLPFKVVPGVLPELCLDSLTSECEPACEEVWVEGEGRWMPETRLTAWQSNIGATFKYSGKEMTPRDGGFTPDINTTHDILEKRFGVTYDSVLINLYPDGRSGMRFHQDPLYDEWQSASAVVSVGDTRTCIFRTIGNFQERFEYRVRNGDVLLMYEECQECYQHCIKVEPRASTVGPRMSLVFKKHLPV